jgi:hypothetical protein
MTQMFEMKYEIWNMKYEIWNMKYENNIYFNDQEFISY